MKINSRKKISYLKFGTIVLFALVVSITSCRNTNKSVPSNSENASIEDTTIEIKKDSIEGIKDGSKIEETNPELNTPDQVALKYLRWRYKIWGKEVADEELVNIGVFTTEFLEKHPRIKRLPCELCAGDVYKKYLIKEPIVNGATAIVSASFCWNVKNNIDSNIEESKILKESDCDCEYKTESFYKIKLWKVNGKWLINEISK